MKSISVTANIVLVFTLPIVFCGTAKATDPPFTIKNGLFDHTQPDHLGLTTAEGTETVPVFQPADSTDHFSNGAVMTVFKDYFYCQWQSSAKDEDAQETWVAYSRSPDGLNWSAPETLAVSIEDGFCSSGGWWVSGDTLIGYINVWPRSVQPRGGYTYYTKSKDGLTWSSVQPVLMANGDTLNGIFEQDPHALPDGRIVNAAHFQPGLNVCPIYTDDPSGIKGWIKANYTNLSSGTISREIEPSWYLRSDSVLVMTFRDQNSTFRRLASVSGDRGESWTIPVLTDMPDSRAKQSAGNLPDGAAYLVGNPVDNKIRIPLVVTLSRDGKYFNTAYLLREGSEGIQNLRYPGNAKRLGFHYPKSMVWQDYLYVSYATNKEDVEYTRVPLVSLIIDTSTAAIHSRSSSEIPNGFTLYQNYPNPFNPATTIKYSLNKPGFVTLSLYDVNGREIEKLVNEPQQAGLYQEVVNVKDLISGVYYYRLQINGRNKTRKMIVLK